MPPDNVANGSLLFPALLDDTLLAIWALRSTPPLLDKGGHRGGHLAVGDPELFRAAFTEELALVLPDGVPGLQFLKLPVLLLDPLLKRTPDLFPLWCSNGRP